MTVSVVVPTYNRAHLIENLFKSLELQTITNFEVVVSSDGSTDNTPQVVNILKSNYSFSINFLDNPHKGRAACRNAGAMASKGDILIFFDDDVRPNSQSIETHLFHHQNFSKSICTGPAYYELSRLETDFHKFRASMEHSWYPKENNKRLKAGMPGANWSIRKSDFFRIGMLNPNLTDSEDFEFSFRATHEHHIPIYYNLQTWVYHDDYKTLGQYINRYIIGNASLSHLFDQNNRIKKEYWQKLHIQRTIIKNIFFRIFNGPYSVKFTESKFFLLLPKKVRYKVYDFIITAQTRYFLDENFNSYKKIRR